MEELKPKRRNETWEQFVGRCHPILKNAFESYVEIRCVQWGADEDDIHEYIAYDGQHPKFQTEEELMRRVASGLFLSLNDHRL